MPPPLRADATDVRQTAVACFGDGRDFNVAVRPRAGGREVLRRRPRGDGELGRGAIARASGARGGSGRHRESKRAARRARLWRSRAGAYECAYGMGSVGYSSFPFAEYLESRRCREIPLHAARCISFGRTLNPEVVGSIPTRPISRIRAPQRRTGALAVRKRVGRRDRPADVPRDHRPRHAPVRRA